jgi:hypothetical protein
MVGLIVFWFPIIGSILLGGSVGYWLANNKRRAFQCGGVGVSMLVMTLVIQLCQYEFPPPAFRVEDVCELNASESGHIVWRQGLQETIGKVRVGEYVTITNLRLLPISVESYRLETAPRESGPWTTVETAPIYADVFWNLDRSHARAFDMWKCDLNYKLAEHSINPGDTIPGWIWITDRRRQPFMRIVLHTSDGGIFTVPILRPSVRKNDVGVRGAPMPFLDKTIDLSGVRYID